MAKGKQFEDSAADKRMDAAAAKRAGVSVKKFENSPADKRMDARGQAKLNRSRKGK